MSSAGPAKLIGRTSVTRPVSWFGNGCASRHDAPLGPAEFSPAWWCRGGHAQTIWASVLRPGPALPGCRRERWETPDGDFLDVDHVPAEGSRPILIVLHGLESSSRAQAVRGMLRAGQRRGWRGIGVNFRSCGGAVNRLRRSYHAGETADLGWVIQRLAAQHPQAPIVCLGISLGGNVLLKYLGEQAGDAPVPLRAAVAVSAPADLAVSAAVFERGPLNRLYMRRLVRRLARKTDAKLRRFPDLVDRRRLAAVRTIREFDELVSAPVHGFASATAYWSESGCRRFLAAIRRPTLLINALDDPLVPAETLCRQEIAQNACLASAFPQAGGHVGFVGGRWPWRPVLWAEETAMRFLAGHVDEDPARIGGASVTEAAAGA